MEKVAIVGVEGSGKTVLMAAMGDKYRTPDANGVFLAPKSRATYAYCAKLAATLRAGKWPLATESGVLNLDWTLLRRQDHGVAPAELGQLSFLDFGGEIYRLAFGDGAVVDLDEQIKQSVTLLKSHVRSADALIVLVNLSDIINGDATDERTIEMNWLSQAIITYAFESVGNRKVALVFSQADTYAETIEQCGGLRGTLATYLPEVDARYGGRLYIFAVAAVNKTIPAPDGSGYPVPAPDFKPEGLAPLLQWMCDGVVRKPGDTPPSKPHHPSPINAGKSSNKLIKAMSCAYHHCRNDSGRASRSEYLWMLLAMWIIIIASLIVGGIMDAIFSQDDGVFTSVLFYATAGLCHIPLMMCFARRLHDRGMSGWWLLLPLVLWGTFVVPIGFLLYGIFAPSKPGENKYGPEPEPF